MMGTASSLGHEAFPDVNGMLKSAEQGFRVITIVDRA